MRRFLATLFGASIAFAVSTANAVIMEAHVVSDCSAIPTITQTESAFFINLTGNLCTNAVLSGTITVGSVTQGAKGPDATADSWYVQPGTGAVFPASQSGTWNITNVSGTVSLPTGASTSALQTTGNSTLTTINTTLGS